MWTTMGTRVLVNGMAPDRDPVGQAEGEPIISKTDEGVTGREVTVRSVVLFPRMVCDDKAGGAPNVGVELYCVR